MAKLGVKDLVEQANAMIATWEPASALEKQQAGSAILVDIRDIRELERDGTVEHAVHAPRGMLEFWFDERSPYHKEYLADESKTYVLYCASGWRSALAAKSLVEMGFENIAHVEGGFSALKKTDAPIVQKNRS